MSTKIIHNRSRKANTPTIVCICPHPDDGVWGAAGTLALLVKAGFSIRVIYVTRGTAGLLPSDDTEIRVSESIEALSILGIDEREIIFGNFEDTRVVHSVDTIRFLEKSLGNLNVTMAFIPSLHSTHNDHVAVAKSALVALRNVRSVLAYESPSNNNDFRPLCPFDISEVFYLKCTALQCFKSQIAQGKPYLKLHKVFSVAHSRGLDFNLEMAEVFEVHRMYIEPSLLPYWASLHTEHQEISFREKFVTRVLG